MALSKSYRKISASTIMMIMIVGIFSNLFVVGADDPPEWSTQNQGKNSVFRGENNILAAQGRDDVGLDYAWLATNETGQWRSYTSVLTPPTEWWNSNWKRRAKLVFNNVGQTQDLVDFPILVVLSSARINYGDFKSDGTDVRFVDPDGTELKYHIEKWDSSGNSYVWVKVPQIDANSASDYVWLYYQNSAAADAQDPSGTYDSDFVGVWHMSESTGTIRDYTSNANNGTANGPTYTSASKIDGGYNFDGTNDYISVPTSTKLNLVGQNFTLEAWAKFDAINNARLISKIQESPVSNAYQLIIDQATSKWGLQVKQAGTDKLCHLSTVLASVGTWYDVVAVVRNVGGDYSGSQLYVNGAQLAISSSPGSIGAAGTSTDLQLGRRPDGNPTTFLDGIEDEVRISNTSRSPSWIKASYLTGMDTFLTYGSVENYGGGPGPEFYGSPMKLNGTANTWLWTNFTWSNSSVSASSKIAWRIYYNDTDGQVAMTDIMTFDVMASLNALVLVNSLSSSYSDFEHRIYPYIKHFGIPYETLDISILQVTADVEAYPLIIIGHTNLDTTHAYLDSAEQTAIVNAVDKGVGLVNFDYILQSAGNPIYNYVQTLFGFTYGADYATSGPITIATNQNYVTSLQEVGNAYSLSGSITGANIIGKSVNATTLVNVGSYPLVLTIGHGLGKAVQFSSYQMLDWNILGYFQGIDDVFWRSFVWAARKPFIMRGIPPFVTMRLDDCNGPYAPYMEQLNGFKMMLSAFLATGDIDALKGYALSEEATVSVHEATYAGGSPSYSVSSPADAVNFWSYYDSTFTNNGIPMAHSWHAHMAETSSYLIPGMEARGIDLFCTDCDFNTALGNVGTNRWAPYMVDQHSPSSRNSYIFEDWNKADSTIFNYYSNAWAYGSPLNSVFLESHIGDVQGAIDEGVLRVERAFDSMTWGLLMTHEPAIESFGYSNFGTVTATIKSRLTADGYDPIYTDIDTIGYYVRAVAGTSHISGTTYDPSSQKVTVTFAGKADVPTKFYVFYDYLNNIESRLVDVPTFDGTVGVTSDIYPQPKPAQNPILVLASDTSNGYSDYVGEMLKTEGLNEFQMEDISVVNSTYLSNFDTVILTSMSLTSGRIDTIKQYVQGGGTLIAFKPDAGLASQFGLTYTGQSYYNGYLKIDNSTSFGSGITGEVIQYKDTADLYSLNGATALASLSNNLTTLSNPAVAYYQSNGVAVIFSYNLPWSIALQRQGNPEWARQDRDLVGGIRPNDMFYNTSGQNHWTDWSKIPIPQADEQQRFLTNIILQASTLKPLPRLWYFPEGKKTLLVMTGDQDGASSSSIETELTDVESYGGYWTQYLWPTQFGTDPNITTEQDWINRGHETAVHYTQTSGTSYTDMNAGYDAQTGQFVSTYGHSPLTVRNHAVIWLGWADSAEIEADHGIHMDVNYYHSSYAFGSTQGYFTGSGLPQKFLRQDGTVIDCYQALTELADEVQLSQQGLTLEQATQVAIELFSKSENGYYSAFVASFHPGGYSGNNRQWANNIMSYAQTNGIPILSAEMLYDFWDARSQANFTNVHYGSDQLTFTLVIPKLVNGLTIMIPSYFRGSINSVEVNGTSHAYTLSTVKGMEYAFVTLNSQGSYSFSANYGADLNPPVISGVTVQSVTDSTATIVWNTDERADSRLKYGTVDLGSEVYDSQMVMYHSVTLTSLTPSTAYSFKVNSTDFSGNSAESTQYQFRTTAQPPMSLIQTTYEDFRAGSLTNTYTSNDTDGEVMLNPSLSDLFLEPSLNTTLWNATRGQFSPGLIPYTPEITNGILKIDNLPNEALGGARILSNTWFSPTVTLEGRIKFGSSSDYKHFGFYDWGPDHDWFITISAHGTQTNTRVNLPGYTNIEVNTSFDVNQFHTLKIEYTPTTIKFYVDGVLRDTRTGTFSASLPIMFAAYPQGPAYADWIRISNYPITTGSFTSTVLDAGSVKNWNGISWNSETPAGTLLEFKTRSSIDNIVWTEWSSPTTLNNSQITSPAGRFIQYSVDFTSSSSQTSPTLQTVRIASSTRPTLLMNPPTRTCRKYNETFAVEIHVSEAGDVQSLGIEISYDPALLDFVGVSWDAWGTGTILIDELHGNITCNTSGGAVGPDAKLVTITFNATYHHLWKDESTIPGWENEQSGPIYIQQANLSYASGPEISYDKDGSNNQIQMGSDFVYAFSPIQGDLDNSGTVEIFDLRTIAAFYDANNPEYNLTNGNIIDIYDLVVVAGNFGYTYSP